MKKNATLSGLIFTLALAVSTAAAAAPFDGIKKAGVLRSASEGAFAPFNFLRLPRQGFCFSLGIFNLGNKRL